MRRMILGAAVAMLVAGNAMAEDDVKERSDAARAAAADFGKALLGELQQAIAAGGPANAIGVCRTIGPEIAAQKSAEWKMTIRRTSLKLRQPANAPDDWERRQLLRFEERKAAGEPPAALEIGEYAEKDGQRVFRYMKAIPTGDLCLSCHGPGVAPEVEARLRKLYPEDQATGFRVGDLRGAFTITETP